MHYLLILSVLAPTEEFTLFAHYKNLSDCVQNANTYIQKNSEYKVNVLRLCTKEVK